jgi:hydrogenase small subunit
MDEPPGAKISSDTATMYGKAIRALRHLTHSTVNKEPKWRHPGSRLTTGYQPRTYS